VRHGGELYPPKRGGKKAVKKVGGGKICNVVKNLVIPKVGKGWC